MCGEERISCGNLPVHVHEMYNISGRTKHMDVQRLHKDTSRKPLSVTHILVPCRLPLVMQIHPQYMLVLHGEFSLFGAWWWAGFLEREPHGHGVCFSCEICFFGFRIMTARIAGELNEGSLDTGFFLLLLNAQTLHPCKPQTLSTMEVEWSFSEGASSSSSVSPNSWRALAQHFPRAPQLPGS